MKRSASLLFPFTGRCYCLPLTSNYSNSITVFVCGRFDRLQRRRTSNTGTTPDYKHSIGQQMAPDWLTVVKYVLFEYGGIDWVIIIIIFFNVFVINYKNYIFLYIKNYVTIFWRSYLVRCGRSVIAERWPRLRTIWGQFNWCLSTTTWVRTTGHLMTFGNRLQGGAHGRRHGPHYPLIIPVHITCNNWFAC